MIAAAPLEELHLAGDAFAIAASCGCVFLLLAAIATLCFPRRRRAAPAEAMPVAILKPLCGSEPGLASRLTSFCEQDYVAPIQLICGVRDAADSAVGLVQPLTAKRFVQLKIDPSDHGSNRKVSNLANMLPLARHDLIVLSDSDIEVGRDYLERIVAELQEPGVGAVTCLFHGVAAANHWSRQAALAINTHFLPNVIAGITFGLAHPCFGSTIAMRSSSLAGLNGLRPFVDALADDYAIGAAVRDSGKAVAIPPFTVGHACFEDGLGKMLAHEIRTAKTIKNINPLGYCGTLITHPFPLGLLAALCGTKEAFALALAALACRVLLCLCTEFAFGIAPQPYWLIPLREILSFSVFVASFFGARITWREQQYQVAASGDLVADSEALSP